MRFVVAGIKTRKVCSFCRDAGRSEEFLGTTLDALSIKIREQLLLDWRLDIILAEGSTIPTAQ